MNKHDLNPNTGPGTDPGVRAQALLLERINELHGRARNETEPAGTRITRACDTCRRKKIKCDWRLPRCGSCVRVHTSCVYTPTKRATKRKTKDIVTLRLEKRLALMEQLFTASDSSVGAQIPSTRLSDLEKQLLRQRQETPFGAPQTSLTLTESSTPSRDTRLAVLDGTHEAIKDDMIFPLFDEPSFMKLCDEKYQDSYRHPSVWCSINVILAQAYRLRAMGPDVEGDENGKAAEHLENALAMAPDLLLQGNDLLSVQAITGIAEILQATSNPRSYLMMVAAAVRLAHCIGLHKAVADLSVLSPVDHQQRMRVLWVLNILDKDISLQSGLPPLIDTDDIDVSLPDSSSTDGTGRLFFDNPRAEIDCFGMRARLSIVNGLVHKLLYSATALNQPEASRIAALTYLNSCLYQWRQDIPLEFTQERFSHATPSISVVHLVVLHSFYFHTLTKVNRRPGHSKFQNGRSETAVQTFDPLHFGTNEFCLSAAREFMALITVGPRGDYAYVWLVLYSAISAVITLLRNALYHPEHSSAAADVECVGPLIDILPTLSRNCENKQILRDVIRMNGFCVELRRRAIAARYCYLDQLQSHSTGQSDPWHEDLQDPNKDIANDTSGWQPISPVDPFQLQQYSVSEGNIEMSSPSGGLMTERFTLYTMEDPTLLSSALDAMS